MRLFFMRYIILFFILDFQILFAQKVFISFDTDCPMCQKYVPILSSFQEKYQTISLEVLFTKWETDSTIYNFKQNFAFKLPYKIDSNNDFLIKNNVKVVPEVLFFDEHQQLIYQGSIDNWFFALGKYRKKATKFFLEDAIKAYLKGECPVIEKTEALGCIIEK